MRISDNLLGSFGVFYGRHQPTFLRETVANGPEHNRLGDHRTIRGGGPVGGRLFRPQSREGTARFLSLRKTAAVVAPGDVDGGDHIFDRHPEPGNRHCSHRRCE